MPYASIVARETAITDNKDISFSKICDFMLYIFYIWHDIPFMSCYLGILYVGCRGVGWQVKERPRSNDGGFDTNIT